MRRLLLFLLSLAVVAGCRGGSSTTMKSDAQKYVDELNEATDPKAIGEISQKLYACGADALEPIGEALDNFDYRAKPQLLMIVSAMPDPKAVWIVDKQLRNRLANVRAMACYGMALRPKAPLSDVVQVLRRDEDSDHEWGSYTLALSSYRQRRAFLLPGLKDLNAYVRAQAVRGFRTIKGGDSIVLVTQLLNDSDAAVATEAFVSLAHLDPKNKVVQQRLVEAGKRLATASTQDKEGLILLIGETDLPQAEPYLSKAMGDADPRIRGVAATAYVRLGKAAKSDRLKRSLTTDPDPHVRAEVGRTIAKLRLDGFGQDLLKMVWEKDPRVAGIAVDTLVGLHRPDCVGPLIYLVNKFPNNEVKRKAAAGLSNMAAGGKPWPEVGEIMEMADAKTPEKRASAAALLGLLQGPRFYIKLQAMQSDPDPGVRIAAMSALKKQIGMSQIFPRVTAHPPPSWLDPLD